MRTFIAIELGDEIRRELVRFLDKLPASDGVKWVGEPQLHVTLKFLGEVTDDQLVDVCRAAEAVSREIPPFPIRVTELGVFPAPRNPRVLWGGIEDPKGGCRRWVERIDPLLAALGFKPETRAYTPHVTFGRSRSTAGGRVLREVLETGALPATPEMLVGEVVVFESQLGGGGPRYRALSRVPLGPAATGGG